MAMLHTTRFLIEGRCIGNAKTHGKTEKKQKKPKGEKDKVSKTMGKPKKNKRNQKARRT